MPTKMHVVVYDENGEATGPGEFVDIPDPKKEAGGLLAIPSYVARLFASTAGSSGFSVLTADQSAGFAVCRSESDVRLLLSVDLRLQPEQEQQIRGFFAARGIAPVADYLSQNGPFPDSVRQLDYKIPSTPEATSSFCREILVECYRVSDDSGLNFQMYEELG